MHAVLQSPDILSTIFANLDHADLARALRVCRLWNEWSDVLWGCLPTLVPMLRLVFPFVFTNSNQYIHSVPLYQLDKSRFAKLAKSVRHFNPSPAPRSFFDGFNPNIPGLLLDLCEPGVPLFPQLQSLSTECSNDSELLGVLSLLTPSLRSLDLSVHHSASDYMHDILTGIEENVKNLEHLRLLCHPPEKNLDASGEEGAQRDSAAYIYVPPISSALTKSLRTLSVPASCMSRDTLSTLSQLPQLESLAFTGAWTSEVHGDEWQDLEATTFQALERLSVPICTIHAALRLLAVFPDSTPLGEIEIAYSGEATRQEVVELAATLARFRSSLQSVRVRRADGSAGLESVQPLDGATLERLGGCFKLETLVLGVPVELSDMEFQSFIVQFPRIRLAHVGNSKYSSE